MTDTEMFVRHYSSDSRFWSIDTKHEVGKKVLAASRRVANCRTEAGEDKALERLQGLMEPLPTGALNILSAMYMISTKWCGATGAGGIWASASQSCNLAARNVLRSRPMFEIVD